MQFKEVRIQNNQGLVRKTNGWLIVWFFFSSEVDLRGLGMQVCTVVPNVLSPWGSSVSAIVSSQRLENVLSNKIGKAQLENTVMDGRG